MLENEILCPHCLSNNNYTKWLMDNEEFFSHNIMSYEMLCCDCNKPFCAEIKVDEKSSKCIKVY